MFQFQHGAIGSVMTEGSVIAFAEVSIPAWCDWEMLPYFVNSDFNACFNSSMVRLGDVNPQKEYTIRESGFNSSMVRLGVFSDQKH